MLLPLKLEIIKPMSQSLVPLKPSQHPVTLVPRFATDLPFFYLTKQKDSLNQDIDFQGTDEAGRLVRWKVSPNTKKHIGASGIEAHEVWVKLIKPAFDAARDRAHGEILWKKVLARLMHDYWRMLPGQLS